MSQKIIITDERPELSRIREVGVMQNVPDNWSSDEIVKRFGIAEHLTVYRQLNGKREIVQTGRRGDPFLTALPETGVVVRHGNGERCRREEFRP